MTCYYQTLGVARTASPDDIKRAYRKLASKLHPDKNQGRDTTSEMQAINAANDVLSDPTKRRSYDATGFYSSDDSLGDLQEWLDAIIYRSLFEKFGLATAEDYRNRRARGEVDARDNAIRAAVQREQAEAARSAKMREEVRAEFRAEEAAKRKSKKKAAAPTPKNEDPESVSFSEFEAMHAEADAAFFAEAMKKKPDAPPEPSPSSDVPKGQANDAKDATARKTSAKAGSKRTTSKTSNPQSVEGPSGKLKHVNQRELF